MTDPGDVRDRLTAVEADNARLRRLLDEAGVADNLRHALRDTMALVRRVMWRSAETSSDVESYVAHLEGRLDSLMRMRGRTDAFGEADLHLLVTEELMFHLVREGERAVIEGPSLRLRPKPAQAMAMAMHELVSNAVEHGPLDVPAGAVEVRWRVEDEAGGRMLTLVWTERGGAIDPDSAMRHGFGREVLETLLAYELGPTRRWSSRPPACAARSASRSPTGSGGSRRTARPRRRVREADQGCVSGDAPATAGRGRG